MAPVLGHWTITWCIHANSCKDWLPAALPTSIPLIQQSCTCLVFKTVRRVLKEKQQKQHGNRSEKLGPRGCDHLGQLSTAASCCIDKTSSVELSEAINSMFKWYKKVEICYVYLSNYEGRDGSSKLDDCRW